MTPQAYQKARETAEAARAFLASFDELSAAMGDSVPKKRMGKKEREARKAEITADMRMKMHRPSRRSA